MVKPDLSAETLIQLIRHLGHDIRAPLGSLISTTDMLAAGVYDPITEKQAKAVERMRRTGQRTLAILDDFVTYVKASSGELPLASKAFQPRALLETCCAQVRDAAEKKGLAVSLETDASVPESLSGDESVIKRIVLPVLWNAAAFTTSGEIRVVSSWDAGGAGWSVTVRDTGSGISADEAPHIFEPFWRGIERPQVPTAGAGLGLPVAQALAHQMNGSLLLKETGPSGSTFQLDFPLKRA